MAEFFSGIISTVQEWLNSIGLGTSVNNFINGIIEAITGLFS